MADEILKRDGNRITVLGGVTDNAAQDITMLRVDPTTKRLLVSFTGAGAGTVTSISQGTGILLSTNPIVATGSVSLATSLQPMATLAGNSLKVLRVNAGETAVEYATVGAGTVTTVSVTTANGVSGSVATATTTPAITLTLGAITPSSVNKVVITAPATSSTLTIADGKTLTANDTTTIATTGILFANSGGLTLASSAVLTVNNILTLAGTNGTTMTFPTTSASIARTDAGQTFTGTQVLAENASIQLDPAGSADGKYTGITVTGVAGYAQTYGDLVYLAAADSRWELADADSATTADRMMAMVVVAGGSDGAACTLLLQGIIRADAKFPALTIGSAVYVGETAGEIQVAIPTGADNVIRRVGYALTADEIYFNPSMDSQITVA